MPDHQHDPDDPTERRLAFDLQTMSRRRALAFFGAGAGALALAACSGSESATPSSASSAPGATSGTTATTPGPTSAASTAGVSTSASSTSASSTSASSTAVPTTAAAATTASGGTVATVSEEIPDETAGPFPGDGSNGPDVLAESDVVRADITRSVGSASGVADGIPLAFPQASCEAAYADARYPGSSGYLADLSLATDGVFRDDLAVHQIAVVTGSNDVGYVATLGVGV
jgi:hypothetical protein